MSGAFVPKVGGLTLSLWLYLMLVNTQPKNTLTEDQTYRNREEEIPCIAVTWKSEGKRKRGRMKETWRYTLAKDLQEFRILKSWTEASTVMQEED